MFVALCIGSLEVLGLFTDRFQFKGRVWDLVYALNDHLDYLGCTIMILFVVCFIVAIMSSGYLQKQLQSRSPDPSF